MKMKFILTVATLTGVSLLNSCVYRVTSVKYDSNAKVEKGDVFYTLSRTVIEADIIYSKKVVTTYENGVPTKENPTYEVKGVVLTPKLVNDGDVYMAKGKNISHSFFLKETIDFQFSSNGTLKSLTAELEDQSPQFIQDGASALVNIAKTVAIAGDEQKAYIAHLQIKVQEAFADYEDSIINGDEENIKRSKEKLERLIKLMDDYLEKNKKETVVSDVTFKQIIDPDQHEWDNDSKKITIGPQSVALKTFPSVTIQIDRPKQTTENKMVNYVSLIKEKKVVQGIVYRIPAEYIMMGKIDDQGKETIITQKVIQFPQYGNYASVPVSSKLFSKRKTELTFSPASGSLEGYKTEAGSSSENFGKALKESSKTLQEAYKYLKFDLEVEELEQGKKIKELEASLKDEETSELDSLKNALELERIRKDIETLQNTELTELEKLKQELEILKIKLEIQKLGEE